MSKKYIVKEKSGCGCWTFFGFLIIAGIFMTYLPIIAGVAVIAAIIWGIVYYPKYKVNKQRKQDEAEIAERERQIELERRRMDLENQEKELKSKRNDNNETEDSNWDDF